MKTTNLAFVLAATGCFGGGGHNNVPADSTTSDSGSNGNGAWTLVQPMASPNTTPNNVTGFWFDSATNGDVSFGDGLIEHFAGPTDIDAIAQDGHDALPGPASDGYYGFLSNPKLPGLVAIGSQAKNVIASSDGGKSFAYSKLDGQIAGAPTGVALSGATLWLGQDAANTWHVADNFGGVWSSPAAPSASATFTLTWHPDGDITVPATVPAADCQSYVGNSYYSDRPFPIFAAAPDGSSLLYGGGEAICRSTDGGKNFVDVSANISPSDFSSHSYPWVFMYTSPTTVVAVYGSDGDAASTAYALYSTDGGKDWTVGTLPPSGANMVALIGAFASPTGTMFLVGAGYGLYPSEGDILESLLLYKSSDGGKTWTDLSANLGAWANSLDNAPQRLATGFALDDQHIWIGGDTGFIAYSATGGE
jgi:hypothetical protein